MWLLRSVSVVHGLQIRQNVLMTHQDLEWDDTVDNVCDGTVNFMDPSFRQRVVLSARGGFIGQSNIDKINAMFKRGKRYGYTDTVFDFCGSLYHYDSNLFKKG